MAKQAKPQDGETPLNRLEVAEFPIERFSGVLENEILGNLIV